MPWLFWGLDVKETLSKDANFAKLHLWLFCLYGVILLGLKLFILIFLFLFIYKAPAYKNLLNSCLLELFKKEVGFGQLLFNVDKVPKQEPFDTSNISHERSSSNKYLNLISILKQSTQEYYNIRMILGLECAKTYS